MPAATATPTPAAQPVEPRMYLTGQSIAKTKTTLALLTATMPVKVNFLAVTVGADGHVAITKVSDTAVDQASGAFKGEVGVAAAGNYFIIQSVDAAGATLREGVIHALGRKAADGKLVGQAQNLDSSTTKAAALLRGGGDDFASLIKRGLVNLPLLLKTGQALDGQKKGAALTADEATKFGKAAAKANTAAVQQQHDKEKAKQAAGLADAPADAAADAALAKDYEDLDATLSDEKAMNGEDEVDSIDWDQYVAASVEADKSAETSNTDEEAVLGEIDADGPTDVLADLDPSDAEYDAFAREDWVGIETEQFFELGAANYTAGKLTDDMLAEMFAALTLKSLDTSFDAKAYATAPTTFADPAKPLLDAAAATAFDATAFAAELTKLEATIADATVKGQLPAAKQTFKDALAAAKTSAADETANPVVAPESDPNVDTTASATATGDGTSTTPTTLR